MTPGQIISQLRTDAQSHSTGSSNPYYGFTNDASSSCTNYYGYLLYSGGYRSGGGGTTPPD